MANVFKALFIALLLANLYILAKGECLCQSGEKPILEKSITKKIEAANRTIANLNERILHLTEYPKQSDNCHNHLKDSTSEMTQIELKAFYDKPLFVRCNMNDYGGGWLIFLRRSNKDTLNFDKGLTEYRKGFSSTESFFKGLDFLYNFCLNSPQELLVILRNSSGAEFHAKYDFFAITNEDDNYRLIGLGAYSGDAGDGLQASEGCAFSTPTNDNDEDDKKCAEINKGGWWFCRCDSDPSKTTQLTGLFDKMHWSDVGKIAYVDMAIRPKRH